MNDFEKALYPKILEYWKGLAKGSINFSSKKHRALIKHLGLISEDYIILEKLYKKQNV